MMISQDLLWLMHETELNLSYDMYGYSLTKSRGTDRFETKKYKYVHFLLEDIKEISKQYIDKVKLSDVTFSEEQWLRIYNHFQWNKIKNSDLS